MIFILFVLIGVHLHMGTAYWICLGAFLLGKVVNFFLED